jgi:hypothetical protein
MREKKVLTHNTCATKHMMYTDEQAAPSAEATPMKQEKPVIRIDALNMYVQAPQINSLV